MPPPESLVGKDIISLNVDCPTCHQAMPFTIDKAKAARPTEKVFQDLAKCINPDCQNLFTVEYNEWTDKWVTY